MVTKEKIRSILKTVLDPELGVNIIDLGLVYGIEIIKREAGDRINILMTLTTPGCPLGGWFVQQVKEVVAAGLKIDEDNIMVEITFDPPWSMELMNDETRAELGF